MWGTALYTQWRGVQRHRERLRQPELLADGDTVECAVAVVARLAEQRHRHRLLDRVDEQAPALKKTLHAVNGAANQVSATAFDHFGLRASEREMRRPFQDRVNKHRSLRAE